MGIASDRKDQRRKEILEAAAALFVEKGFDGASFNEIAVRARASKETLYAWFGNKIEILKALLREGGETLRLSVEAEAAGGTPEQVLFVLARAILRTIATTPVISLFGAALAGAQRHPELRELIAERLDGTALALYLEMCRAQGLMAFENAARTAMIFSAMAQGDYSVRLSAGLIEGISEEEIEAHARVATKMFLKAVAP